MNDALHRDIPGRRIAVLGIAWAGLVVVAVVGVIVLLRVADMPWTQARPPGPRVEGPLQESAPQPALQEYLAGKQARLEGIGWVDQPAGVAHIPIDEAMKMMASGAAPSPAASAPRETSR
jgi:hypothetical protein